MKLKISLIVLSSISFFSVSWGQFSGNNLAEYQFGNIPGVEPSDVHSVYDQFNLEYKLKAFKVSGRLENYYSNDTARIQYTKLTQYTLSYRKKGLNFKLGNFYETLGKGLLYRGYEVKNSIYEDQIYRIKQGFYRDLQGASGSYSNKLFSLKAIYGKSLINDLPPTSDENRLDLVSAGEANVRFLNQTGGIIFLQNDNGTEKANYASALLGGTLLNLFDYYGEYAHRVNSGDQFFGFSEDDSYGSYFSLGYSQTGFGISFELKDYQNLFIGSGISDPPTLVKEHSYKLLNRSTHVPFYFDESGMQVEVFIVPAENHLLTLNHSRSKNELGESVFQSAEYFADWQFTFRSKNQIKFFADYSFDEILFENARYTSGIYFTRTLPKNWSYSIETEFQHLERTFSETQVFQNIYTGLIVNYSTKFSAAFVWEFTNDNKFADLGNTEEVESKQNFPGINFSYKPNRKNTIQLFAGKRRGGPACTSGVCYEVLDFKGLELRWSTKF